jgi:hypothetical protein
LIERRVLEQKERQVEAKRDPREQALVLVRLLVPYWPPTARQVLWAIRIGIVLGVLVLMGYPYGITLWNWLQILVFPAAVAVGAFVFDQVARERERARDEANAENEYRKEFLVRMMRAYNDTKKVRRVLKAHRVPKSESNEEEIPCTEYEEQLEKLMDAQLEFEVYKPDKEKQPIVLLAAFENDGEAISNSLRKLEQYLSYVIDEYDGGDYQHHKQKLGIDDSPRIPLKNLPKLKAFVDTDLFNREFSSVFRSMAEKIQEEIKRAY